MKRILLLLLALLPLGVLSAQTPVYEYSYDAAGNRVLRAILPLHKGGDAPAVSRGSDPEEGLSLVGAAVRVFPNPTRGTVRVESADTVSIAGYRLHDARGLLLEQGRVGSCTVTLDLSGRADGVYLLDVWLGAERRHFRIVKG